MQLAPYLLITCYHDIYCKSAYHCCHGIFKMGGYEVNIFFELDTA